MPLEESALVAELKRRAGQEDGPKENGIPDRWLDAHLRRCPNDHVSSTVLKSEAQGRNACLACYAPVFLTFPEDKDGPLGLTDEQPGTEAEAPEWQKQGFFDPNDGWG